MQDELYLIKLQLSSSASAGAFLPTYRAETGANNNKRCINNYNQFKLSCCGARLWWGLGASLWFEFLDAPLDIYSQKTNGRLSPVDLSQR